MIGGLHITDAHKIKLRSLEPQLSSCFTLPLIQLKSIASMNILFAIAILSGMGTRFVATATADDEGHRSIGNPAPAVSIP